MIVDSPVTEPPFVETPEPKFGAVIQKLNEITVQAEEKASQFNGIIESKLLELDTHVTQWVAATITPIDNHLAKKGAVHGETKSTVGLSKKDNFRTATKAEAVSFANVNAFVTPEGAKASLVANTGEFVLGEYQRNGVFQFASYYYPDDYPTGIPTAPEASRFLTSKGRVPILINGDRLIYSPQSDTSKYQMQSLFVGLPLKGLSRARLSEIANVAVRYTGNNWNMVAADTTDGKVGFFRPLSDKSIYNFTTTLPLPAGNRNYLLFNRFSNTTYKGLGITAGLTGTTLKIDHRFFSVVAADTAPSMSEVITSAYLGAFDQIGTVTPTTAPANGSHQYDLKDFITLPAGASIALDAQYPGVVTTLLWNVIDYEIYLNIAVAVVVTRGELSKKLNLSFTESIIPGNLVSGDSAAFRTLGVRVKDTLDDELNPASNATFFTVNNPFDFNNATQSPGVVLNSGTVVKSISSKLGLRVKRYKTAYAGIKDWMMAKRPVVNPADALTEVFAPSRHSPFGPLPERIIPVTHSDMITQYLVYGLNPATGLFSWSLLTWNDTSVVSTQTVNNVFGIRLPEVKTPMDSIGLMPSSLTVRTNKTAVGTVINGLAFTGINRHIGKASFSFVNGVLTVGDDVTLATTSMLSIQAKARGVSDRAAVLNPTLDPDLRVTEIQVYAVSATKALVVISDGVSYAEAAAANYSVVNNLFTLDFKPTNGLALKPITPASGAVALGNRKSGSGDDPWMACADLQVDQINVDTFNFVLTRPFGQNYGDISFSVVEFEALLFPTFTPGKVNPVRLYAGTQQIDMVEELLPPILIPNKGVFQYDAANTMFTNTMLEVGGATKVDQFDVNEPGWIRVPSGGRVMLGGKAYVLGEEFALKVNPNGTSYCYLIRYGDVITVVASDTRREVGNNEVMFGIAVNGVLQQTKDYLVMSNHVVSATRCGTAIPCFADDGANGVNKFFTKRDVF